MARPILGPLFSYLIFYLILPVLLTENLTVSCLPDGLWAQGLDQAGCGAATGQKEGLELSILLYLAGQAVLSLVQLGHCWPLIG